MGARPIGQQKNSPSEATASSHTRMLVQHRHGQRSRAGSDNGENFSNHDRCRQPGKWGAAADKKTKALNRAKKNDLCTPEEARQACQMRQQAVRMRCRCVHHPIGRRLVAEVREPHRPQNHVSQAFGPKRTSDAPVGLRGAPGTRRAKQARQPSRSGPERALRAFLNTLFKGSSAPAAQAIPAPIASGHAEPAPRGPQPGCH